MPRKNSTRNMERVSDSTPSSRKKAKIARANGRSGNAAYTAGARSVNGSQDSAESMQERWNVATGKSKSRNEKGQFKKDNGNVNTYTSTKGGKMSADGGRRAGGATNRFSKNTGDGHGTGMGNRRVRYSDVRSGFNDISPKAAKAMLDAGQMTQAEYNRITGVGGTGAGGGGGRSGGRGLGLSAG